MSLLTIVALLASTLVVSTPTMAFSNDIVLSSQHGAMVDCTTSVDASAHSHHNASNQTAPNECGDASKHNCCSATCANGVGVISADLMHSIHHYLFSKRTLELAFSPICRANGLDRPPRA
ncbi:hypothetical protein ACFPCW_04580 [Vibrio thalassae]|nr:hypothetical protein [Vibrio thalassae]